VTFVSIQRKRSLSSLLMEPSVCLRMGVCVVLRIVCVLVCVPRVLVCRPCVLSITK